MSTFVDITAAAYNCDLNAYIRFANQLFNSSGVITASMTGGNGLRVFNISENTTYRVTMEMQNRFRLGCLANLNTGQTVTNFVIDPLDQNDLTSQNGAPRTLTITSGAGQVYLLVGAWSSQGATTPVLETLDTIIVLEEQAATTYTVTFVDWDGTVLKTESVTSGGDATPPSNPSRTGYNFTGWSDGYTNVTNDVTITAQYSRIYCVVTFVDWDGRELARSVRSYGGTAYPPDDPVRGGYTFTGWSGSYTNLTGDVTITAQYAALPTVFSEACGDNLTATLDRDSGVLTISGTGAMYDYAGSIGQLQFFYEDVTSVVIESGATGIGDYAFRDYTSLISVTIPSTVTRIGYGAFTSCVSLSTVNLPSSVTSIDDEAFFGCSSLTAITIPSTVTSIGESAFSCCGLTEIAIPSTVTSIGEAAFNQCHALTSVTLPEGLLTIGAQAFYSCTALTEITIPSTVTSIGSLAFSICTAPLVVTILQDQGWISGSPWGANMTGNRIIWAGVPAPTYTVTFVDWDGTVLKTEQVASGGDATPPSNPSRTGYTFMGWSGSYTNVTADTTVTATYALRTFTVTFTDIDGTVLKTETVNYGSSATPPDSPVHSGQIFSGWSASFKNVTSNVSTQAQYSALRAFLVRFLSAAGKVLKAQYVSAGGSGTAPAAPSVWGKSFTGWSSDFDYVTGNTDVTASYSDRSDSFTVTFVDWDGTVLKTEVVQWGQSATAPTPPSRAGYVFHYWSHSFACVTADTTITACYREERARLAAVVYNNGTPLVTIDRVLDCTLSRALSGESSLSITTLASLAGAASTGMVVELSGQLFTIITRTRSIRGGLFVTTLDCEHITYALNDDGYKLDEFSFTGTPSACLAALLSGTPFSVGAVDFSENVTLNINKKNTTRREALMQLIALCDGEIEYDGASIGIRSHIGASEPVSLMNGKNVTDVSCAADLRNGTENYTVKLYKRAELHVGDEVSLVFTPLGINAQRRITALSYNPFYPYSVELTLGSYRPSINDTLYTVAKTAQDAGAKADNTADDLDGLMERLDTLVQTGGGGGLAVRSVDELPANPESGVLYLIRGTHADTIWWGWNSSCYLNGGE